MTVNGGKAYDYKGSAIEPQKDKLEVKIRGRKVPDTCYEITGYYNNINKGTATLMIRGMDAYYGNRKVTFKIGAVKVTDIWGGLMNSLAGLFK